MQKNKTDGGLFAIHTGAKNLNELGYVEAWNEQTTMNTWPDTPATCNVIKGGDTSVFPPHLTAEVGSLHIFSADICRCIFL